jgi:hypothetical protein
MLSPPVTEEVGGAACVLTAQCPSQNSKPGRSKQAARTGEGSALHLVGEHFHIEVVSPCLDLAVGGSFEHSCHRQ